MLPKLLAETLKERGLSNRAAAEEMGVAHSTVGRIINGKPYDVDTLILVCKWIGVSPASVLASDSPIEEDVLAAKIALLVEARPALKEVFEEALERFDQGKVGQQAVQDLIQYAAFRLSQEGN